MTDAEWEEIEPLIPLAKQGGRKRTVNIREVVNAIFYIDRSGCQWRMLPKDFPPRTTVDTYFYQWRNDGTLKKIHDQLRNYVRQKVGKEDEPTAAVVDSQSVKTAEKGGLLGMMQARKQRGESVIYW